MLTRSVAITKCKEGSFQHDLRTNEWESYPCKGWTLFCVNECDFSISMCDFHNRPEDLCVSRYEPSDYELGDRIRNRGLLGVVQHELSLLEGSLYMTQDIMKNEGWDKLDKTSDKREAHDSVMRALETITKLGGSCLEL